MRIKENQEETVSSVGTGKEFYILLRLAITLNALSLL